jgi:hypothetical protein
MVVVWQGEFPGCAACSMLRKGCLDREGLLSLPARETGEFRAGFYYYDTLIEMELSGV